MNRSRKIVILCESYGSIQYVLYRIEQEQPDTAVTVFITALEDLYRLFLRINEKVMNGTLHIVFYQPYRRQWVNEKGLKKLVYVVVDTVKEYYYLRRFYRLHFANLRNAEVFYPSLGYSGAKIYILKKLAKHNKLTYIDPGEPRMGKRRPQTIREWLMLLLFKVVYGRHCQIGQYPADNPWSIGFPYCPIWRLRGREE